MGGWWNRQFDPEIDLIGRSGLVVVSRSGTELAGEDVDLVWGPQDLVDAWRS